MTSPVICPAPTFHHPKQLAQSKMSGRRARSSTQSLEERPAKRHAFSNQSACPPEYSVARVNSTATNHPVTRSQVEHKKISVDGSDRIKPTRAKSKLMNACHSPFFPAEKPQHLNETKEAATDSCSQLFKEDVTKGFIETKREGGGGIDAEALKDSLKNQTSYCNTATQQPVMLPPFQSQQNASNALLFGNGIVPPNPVLISQMMPAHLLGFYPQTMILGMPTQPGHILSPPLLGPIGYPPITLPTIPSTLSQLQMRDIRSLPDVLLTQVPNAVGENDLLSSSDSAQSKRSSTSSNTEQVNKNIDQKNQSKGNLIETHQMNEDESQATGGSFSTTSATPTAVQQTAIPSDLALHLLNYPSTSYLNYPPSTIPYSFSHQQDDPHNFFVNSQPTELVNLDFRIIEQQGNGTVSPNTSSIEMKNQSLDTVAHMSTQSNDSMKRTSIRETDGYEDVNSNGSDQTNSPIMTCTADTRTAESGIATVTTITKRKRKGIRLNHKQSKDYLQSIQLPKQQCRHFVNPQTPSHFPIPPRSTTALLNEWSSMYSNEDHSKDSNEPTSGSNTPPPSLNEIYEQSFTCTPSTISTASSSPSHGAVRPSMIHYVCRPLRRIKEDDSASDGIISNETLRIGSLQKIVSTKEDDKQLCNLNWILSNHQNWNSHLLLTDGVPNDSNHVSINPAISDHNICSSCFQSLFLPLFHRIETLSQNHQHLCCFQSLKSALNLLGDPFFDPLFEHPKSKCEVRSRPGSFDSLFDFNLCDIQSDFISNNLQKLQNQPSLSPYLNSFLEFKS